MSTPIEIKDGTQRVTIQRGALSVTQFPPDTDEQIVIPVIRPLTVGGDGTTSDLKVDGSTTSIQAFLGADADGDIFITEINIIILGVTGGSNALLSDFAAITGGLTNGCVLFRNIRGSINELREFPLRTNFDFVSSGTLTAPIGADGAAFRLKDVLPGNNSFGYNPRLDLRAINPPFGLRLEALTADKLGIIIQDDLTVADVSAFTINAIGFKRLSP